MKRLVPILAALVALVVPSVAGAHQKAHKARLQPPVTHRHGKHHDPPRPPALVIVLAQEAELRRGPAPAAEPPPIAPSRERAEGQLVIESLKGRLAEEAEAAEDARCD